MDEKTLLRHIDHTCLQVDATWEQIETLCREGITYGVASVCIPPLYVEQAVDYAAGAVPICTVIGFPNGYQTTEGKVFETETAIAHGAAEIDMVASIGWIKAGAFDRVQAEIEQVKAACRGRILKVIIEACLLTEAEKRTMCRVVTAAGADYIKTSTGFAAGGATREDVALFAQEVGPGVKVKAAGGIRTVEAGLEFLRLGADRIGSSGIVKQIGANVR